eukprot:10682721-Alexandrium_andersonii.AAC.1
MAFVSSAYAESMGCHTVLGIRRVGKSNITATAAIAAGSPWGIDPVETTTSGAVSPANSMTLRTSDQS